MLSKNPVKCFQRGIVEICGNWTITGGSGAVDVTTGQGFSVARTSAGVYTITFDDVYQEFVSGSCSIQFATATSTNFDLTAQFGICTLASRTLVVRIWDYSGAAVGDPAAGDAVHFSVKMKWTTV